MEFYFYFADAPAIDRGAELRWAAPPSLTLDTSRLRANLGTPCRRVPLRKARPNGSSLCSALLLRRRLPLPHRRVFHGRDNTILYPLSEVWMHRKAHDLLG